MGNREKLTGVIDAMGELESMGRAARASALGRWKREVAAVRDSLPCEATPESVRGMLREGMTPAEVRAASLSELVPYAPLTIDEVQALNCMEFGAPVSTEHGLHMQQVCNALLALVAKGERPVDPATLPNWDAEAQIEWLAHSGCRLGSGKGAYWVVGREGDVLRSFPTPAEAINAAMRAAFAEWCADKVVIQHQPVGRDKPSYWVDFGKNEPVGPASDTKQGALLSAWQCGAAA